MPTVNTDRPGLPSYDASLSTSPAASRRLFRIGVTGLVAAGAWLWYQSPLQSQLQLQLGLAILLLSAWPILDWARKSRQWFPAFEIFMLTAATFYAVPLLTLNDNLQDFTPPVITKSAWAVVLFLLAGNFAFARTRGRSLRSPTVRRSLLPASVLKWIPLGLAFNAVYLYLDGFTPLIPHDFVGVLRAVSFGLGIVATFIVFRLWGAGLLQLRTKVMVSFLTFVIIILTFAQLYLITGMSLLILGLIAYISAGRHLPWIALVIITPMIAILHVGKTDMRRIYWNSAIGQTARVDFTDLPAFYVQWVGYGLHPTANKKHESASERLLNRASLLQMLCYSVERVPVIRPYLLGSSYTGIPALFIPRFLWPDKPSALASNVELAVYCGLVPANSPLSVSIAFGMLAEAYLNFGLLAVTVLGALFGFGFKRAAVYSLGAPQFSPIGLFMILLTAWSFQAEMAMATWVSSLFQASVVTIGLPVLYHHLTVQEV